MAAACCCPAQTFMRALAAAVKPRPASLSNYRRMREPCVAPKAEVQADRQLSRVALFRQVQVGLWGWMDG